MSCWDRAGVAKPSKRYLYPAWRAACFEAASMSTLQAAGLKHVFERLVAAGQHPRELESAIGVSRRTLRKQDARLPASRLHALYRCAARSERSRSLPFDVAATAGPQLHGVLGMLAATAPSALHALRGASAAYPLICDRGRMACLVGADRVRLRWCMAAALDAGVQLANEAVLAHFAVSLRRVVDGVGQPLLVRFRHASAGGLWAATELFRCHVEYGCDADEVVYTRAQLQTAPVRSDPWIHAHFQAQAQDQLAALRQVAPDIRAATRQAIRRLLEAGEANRTRVAGELGYSSRTFLRRLGAAGSTFRAELEQVRQQEAKLLLGSGLPADEVAHRTGYSDASALRRAQRRWRLRGPR